MSYSVTSHTASSGAIANSSSVSRPTGTRQRTTPPAHLAPADRRRRRRPPRSESPGLGASLISIPKMCPLVVSRTRSTSRESSRKWNNLGGDSWTLLCTRTSLATMVSTNAPVNWGSRDSDSSWSLPARVAASALSMRCSLGALVTCPVALPGTNAGRSHMTCKLVRRSR